MTLTITSRTESEPQEFRHILTPIVSDGRRLHFRDDWHYVFALPLSDIAEIALSEDADV